jgi:hypothetical protein
MRAFDTPAPDLQIIAADRAALEAGDWQLLLGEIHPDLAIWEHCFLMWCPDPEALAVEYRETGHASAISFGPTRELGVHILCRAHERSDDWTFLRPLWAPGSDSLSRAEALVDHTGDDLVVRDRQGRARGSLLHQWRVAGNTHRFEWVGTGAHSPRLRVGRVIVQRESWRIEPDQALCRAVAEVGPDALLALRALRHDRGWPEEVFVRPELPLRHTYHKDAKPILVDFRNPILLEVLSGWMRRYLRLRVSEMLPAPEHCWLTDGNGRYACELRMVAMPRSHDLAQARSPMS